MEVFVARQPIFTKNQELFAYELLYRSNRVNSSSGINGDEATTEVIINSFLNIGINELTNCKPCFINFTEKLLHLKIPNYFRPQDIVVEILETVDFNEEIVEVCKELKGLEYQIALDDFVLDRNNPYVYQVLEYTDIIKVDFRQSTEDMRREIENLSVDYNIQLLAEKIETKDEFETAIKRGYEYFQGYYFSKPIVLTTHDVPSYFHSHFEIINHLSQDEPNIDHITQLIEQDLSLSYKLLKLINSPAFRPIHKINSIRQAIVLLGLIEVKKWIHILAFRENTHAENDVLKELISQSFTRAKMCEYIALKTNRRMDVSSYFMTGMFSLIDKLLNIPLEQILKELPLQEDICDALHGSSNHLNVALNLCINVEQGEWEEVSEKCSQLELDDIEFLSYYKDSINWTNQLMKFDIKNNNE